MSRDLVNNIYNSSVSSKDKRSCAAGPFVREDKIFDRDHRRILFHRRRPDAYLEGCTCSESIDRRDGKALRHEKSNIAVGTYNIFIYKEVELTSLREPRKNIQYQKATDGEN